MAFRDVPTAILPWNALARHRQEQAWVVQQTRRRLRNRTDGR
jgi:hypothetical protein